MENEDSKSKNVKMDGFKIDFVVTLAKVVEDNERLKKRVDALEESFKDKLASLEQENETLQKHLSALISLTESELRRERAESKKESHKLGNRVCSQNPDDGERSEHRSSQYCKRYKSSYDRTTSKSWNHRDTSDSSHERDMISSRDKSYNDRHSSSLCKSTNRNADGECADYNYRNSENTSRCIYNVEKFSHERRSGGSSQRSSASREKVQNQESKYSVERSRVVERRNIKYRDKHIGLRGDKQLVENDSNRCKHRSCDDNKESIHVDSNGLISRNGRNLERSNHQIHFKSSHAKIVNSEAANEKHTNPDFNQRSHFNMTRSLQNQNIEKDVASSENGSMKDIEKSKHKIQNELLERERDESERIAQFDRDISASDTRKELSRGKLTQSNAEKRKRIYSPKEKRNSASNLDASSSREITLWNSAGEMQIIQTEDLKKIYSTPMKFFSFPDYKLISPLPNTPDQLKEKFKEMGNVKISPVPLLLSENRGSNENRVLKESERKTENDTEERNEPIASADVSLDNHGGILESQIKDSVEVQTVTKTDDVEHGVFKRKRRV